MTITSSQRNEYLFDPATTMDPTCHLPVLKDEVITCLGVKAGQTIVDGTLGGGGHTLAISEVLGNSGRLISIDRDATALDRFEPLRGERSIQLAQANFSNIPEVLDVLQVQEVDGVLLDLGLSSDQLADHSRGFSFHSKGPLDLRFDTSEGEPAWRLMERLSQRHLADLLYEFGEERLSRRIATAILARLQVGPLQEAAEIAGIIEQVYPRFPKQRIHPATRSFQALRIAVNDELKSLKLALSRIPDRLAVGGILAVISFHSLEDRMVKHTIRGDERLTPHSGKAIMASEEEIVRNPRSRSARLRWGIRKGDGDE